MWRHLVPKDSRSSFFGTECTEWAHNNVTTKTTLDRDVAWNSIWATRCHQLLSWRNKHEHDPSFIRPYLPHRVVLSTVTHYLHGRLSLYPSRKQSLVEVDVKWLLPEPGLVCVNTDGALKEGMMLAACGGVTRDSNGLWLEGFSRCLGYATVYMAELCGTFEGLTMANEKGFTRVELRMDSQVAVDCLLGKKQGSMHGRILVSRIRALLDLEWQVRVCHIYREANAVADGQASLGCTHGGDLIIYDSPPPSIRNLLDADLLGVSTPRLIPVQHFSWALAPFNLKKKKI